MSNRLKSKNPEKTGRAVVRFFEDARNNPPVSHYCAPTKVPGSSNMWSLCFEFDEELSNENLETEADFAFLVDKAPVKSLEVGQQLKLYEGQLAVAEVEILELPEIAK